MKAKIKPESETATQSIPVPDRPGKPYFTPEGVDRVLRQYENQAYHQVHHTESYNKPWVDGETQMTLQEIGRQIEFVKRCMGMVAVAVLAVLLITLLKS